MKKFDLDRKFKMVKDAGDVRKTEKCVSYGSSQITKQCKECDRGDTLSKNLTEKTKLYDKLVAILPRNVDQSSRLREAGKPKELAKLEVGKTKELTKLEAGKTKDLSKLEAGKTKDLTKLEVGKTKELTKLEVGKTKELTKLLEELKTKDLTKLEAGKTKELTKLEAGKTKEQSKLEHMRKIKESYTFRNKYSLKREMVECVKKNSVEKVHCEVVNDRTPKKSEVPKPAAELEPSTKMTTSRDVADKSERRKTASKTNLTQVIRRPIIKTVTSKNDRTKVYKAVNFVEKKPQPTPLQINIPMDNQTVIKKEKIQESSKAKVSVREKRHKSKKKKDYSRPPLSPDVTVRIGSPPTEVAKWANADSHRRLYYEAWVDTTLAAISKKVKSKKYDQNKLLQTFQKALAERPLSPDFDYKLLLDEHYTGKITVNKR